MEAEVRRHRRYPKALRTGGPVAGAPLTVLAFKSSESESTFGAPDGVLLSTCFHSRIPYSQNGASLARTFVASGNGCSSSGAPSGPRAGMSAVIRSVEIWDPCHMGGEPMGYISEEIRMAATLPIMESPWVKASAGG